MFITFFVVDLFIAGKAFIFMLVCLYVLIHSLIHSVQAQLLSSRLFVLTHWFIHYRHSFYLHVLMYWFIHCRYSFYLYNYLFLFIYSFVVVKTIDNLRNRRTVELVTPEEKLKKLAAQPSFKQFKMFHENRVGVERAKVELTLNRPIHVGFAILDLLKTLMCDFHYN